jgi:hypothetical protein
MPRQQRSVLPSEIKEVAMKKLALAVLMLGASAGPGFAQQACLMAGQILKWTPVDSRTLIVEDIVHRKFKVSLNGTCPNLQYNIGAGFISRSNSQLACLRQGDMVVHRGYAAGNRCPIKSVQLYTPAMQKADEAAAAAAKMPGNH